MTFPELIKSYQHRIKELRADIELTQSYGGPIVGAEKLRDQKIEVAMLESIIRDIETALNDQFGPATIDCS